MSEIMAVILDGVAQLEYYRNKPLPAQQQVYLDNMDKKMDAGIRLGEQSVDQPDTLQRAEFVAGHLAQALIGNDEAACSAMSAYLATRLPDLKQVVISTKQQQPSIELVFDEEYKKQVAVKFIH